jgi:hypothetical protein
MLAPTVEDALRRIECAAAALRFALESGACAPQPPDRPALNGLADNAADIETLAVAIRRVLRAPLPSIDIAIERPRHI